MGRLEEAYALFENRFGEKWDDEQKYETKLVFLTGFIQALGEIMKEKPKNFMEMKKFIHKMGKEFKEYVDKNPLPPNMKMH